MRLRLLAVPVAACLALGLGSGAARAQTSAPPPAEEALDWSVVSGQALSLEECLALALAHNPRLAAVHADVRMAGAGLRGARKADDPRVGVTGRYTLLEQAPRFTIPQMGTLVYGERQNWDLGLALRIPIYTGGKTGAYKDQARAMLDVAVAGAARERQSVARDTVVAYFAVLKAADIVAAAEEHQKSLAAQEDAVRQMFGVGLVPKLDALRAEVARKAADEGLTQARNAHATALASLRAVLGAPPETGLAVSGVYQDAELPREMPAALDEAHEARPEVAAMRAYRRAAAAGVDLARAGKDPQLGFFAQWDFLRSTAMPQTGRWMVGLGLTWDILDGGEASSAEDRARAQIEKVDAQLASLNDGITLQVTQALLNLGAAAERVRTTEAALASADEAVDLAGVSYANELVPLTDLLAAEDARLAAKTGHAAALYDLRVAGAEYVFALGR
jgi:outer membrane protein